METYIMLKKVTNLEMSKIIANFIEGNKVFALTLRKHMRLDMDVHGMSMFDAFKFELSHYTSPLPNGREYLMVWDFLDNCKNYVCDDLGIATNMAYNALVKKGMLL